MVHAVAKVQRLLWCLGLGDMRCVHSDAGYSLSQQLLKDYNDHAWPCAGHGDQGVRLQPTGAFEHGGLRK